MKTVGIIFNPEKKRALIELSRLNTWLRKKGCKVLSIASSTKKFPALDIALTLGGDGTMLKASRMLANLQAPVLGINLGSLGFLAETNPKDMYPILSNVLAGKYQVEERLMLKTTIKSKQKTIEQLALNDIIIHSGNTGRVINISARINKEFLADYVGDGVIIATPTGSTAYSLAAYGPIVHPHLSVFILTPICPHTLTQRPLIISNEHTISLSLNPKTAKEKPVVSIDGQINYALSRDDVITVCAAKKPLRLIINPERKYFKVLRTKLKWGERG